MNSQTAYIEVFDWERSTHCQAIILIFPGVKIVRLCFSQVPVFTDEIQISPGCLLPGGRLLPFSGAMVIYSFTTAAGVDPEVTIPSVAPRITEPLWKLPFTANGTKRGALSEGLSIETAAYFVVELRNLHRFVVAHSVHQELRSCLLLEFDIPKLPICVIGIEKAFVQHIS